jgi:hypothetical protein
MALRFKEMEFTLGGPPLSRLSLPLPEEIMKKLTGGPLKFEVIIDPCYIPLETMNIGSIVRGGRGVTPCTMSLLTDWVGCVRPAVGADG